jgi:peroxiredoxin
VSLKDELDAVRARSRAALDEKDRRVLDDAVERLRMMQIAEHALAPGDILPDFALPDAKGRVHTSETYLERGPLVLGFFRGGWCPYCDATLRALERARPSIEALGASLVGVTPDGPEAVARAVAEKGLNFALLSDPGGRFTRLCGALFELTEAHIAFYRARGLDLPALHAGSGWVLPVPCLYVVRPDGQVVFAHADPDYTRRAEPEAILGALAGSAQAAASVG